MHILSHLLTLAKSWVLPGVAARQWQALVTIRAIRYLIFRVNLVLLFAMRVADLPCA